MKSLVILTRDASSLISLEEAKTFLRVSGTDEDSLITAMINGSVSYIENYLNKTVGNNTYTMTIDGFTDEIKLMRPPVTSVTSISYVDVDGATQSFDLAKIILDKENGFITLKQDEVWPDTASEAQAVIITYACSGMYAANDANDVIDALKMTIASRYDHREDVSQRWRRAVDDILQPLRIKPFD